MNYFCCYFDKNYLLRGLTLFRSLCQHNKKPFTFYVICLDDYVYEVLLTLNRDIKNIVPIALSSIEGYEKELLNAKSNRSLIEYYFTLTPVIQLFLLDTYQIDMIVYLDADLYFYADTSPIFDAFSNHSILLIEHKFPENLKHKEIYGKYNVQFLIFKKDINGISALKWWKDKCIEWCYDFPENDRYADQKYLDHFEKKFNNVLIFDHNGVGLAPWNFMKYTIKQDDSCIKIDNQDLIFFHFHGLKVINKYFINRGLNGYYSKSLSKEMKFLYSSYAKQIILTAKWLKTNYTYKIGMSDSDIRKQLSLPKIIYSSIKNKQLAFVR